MFAKCTLVEALLGVFLRSEVLPRRNGGSQSGPGGVQPFRLRGVVKMNQNGVQNGSKSWICDV